MIFNILRKTFKTKYINKRFAYHLTLIFSKTLLDCRYLLKFKKIVVKKNKKSLRTINNTIAFKIFVIMINIFNASILLLS